MKRFRRGEIYRADLNPTKGTEIKGSFRPVLIIQNDAVTDRIKSVVAIPFTTTTERKKWPFAVSVKANKGNGLEKDSVLLCHQTRVLDKDRLKKKMGRLSENKLAEVEKTLFFTFDIDYPV